jgi:hypothetical protein
MPDLDLGSELRRLVLRYFKDQGGVIGYKNWNRFDIETAGRLDLPFQSEWIAEGYIQTNPEKGGYELTAAGQEELRLLTAVKFHGPLDKSRDPIRS